MKEIYDKIGFNYNSTRKADPHILERIFYHLSPVKEKKYLDIGCGTGNYTIALHQKGIDMVGVDPSLEMLKVAKSKNDTIEWKLGKAEAIPIENEKVDGIIVCLTLHHWKNLKQGFKELFRILNTTGKIIIFTSTPLQMQGYWLNRHFPKMMKDSILQMPSYEKIEKSMAQNGFEIIKTEPYFVKKDLQDLFLYSGKHRPELYLNKSIRQGISSFSSLSNAKEVEKGLENLANDIETRTISTIIQNYENDIGDYLFIVAKR